MGNVKIFVDSGAGFNPILFEHGAGIVPLQIIVSGKGDFSDDKLPLAKLLRFLEEGKRITTSAPNPQIWLANFQEAKEQGYTGIVCITLPSPLSRSFDFAQIAATDFRERKGIDVAVFDSKTVSMAQAFYVIKATEAAEEGASCQEIINLLESARVVIHIWAFIEDLQYAVYGGRVTKKEAAKLSTRKAIVTLEEGKPLLKEPGILLNNAIKIILERIKEAKGLELELEYVSVVHIDAPNRAQILAKKIASSLGFPLGNIIVTEASSLLAVYGGPGAFGVAFSTTQKG